MVKLPLLLALCKHGELVVLRSFSIPSPRVWLALCKICQGTLSEKFTCFDLDPPAQLLFIVSIREEGKAGPLSLVGRNSPKTHQLPASSVPLGFLCHLCSTSQSCFTLLFGRRFLFRQRNPMLFSYTGRKTSPLDKQH